MSSSWLSHFVAQVSFLCFGKSIDSIMLVLVVQSCRIFKFKSESKLLLAPQVLFDSSIGSYGGNY